MKSENISYNPRLDELRGIACLMVFMGHIAYYTGWIDKDFSFIDAFFKFLARDGVILFLILSGYLFATIFINKETINYKKFVYNRFLRIFPLFLLYMLFTLTISSESFNADNLIFYPLLSWNIPLSNGMLDINNVSWTIAVEFQFYLIFPFIFLFYKKTGINYLLKIIVLIVLLRVIAISYDGSIIYSSFLGQFNNFIFGIILAINFHKLKDFGLFNFFICAISLMLSLCIGAFLRYFNSEIMIYEIPAFFSVLFIYFYINQKRLLPILYVPFQKLGIISYSFYLTHQICLKYVFHTVHGHKYLSVLLAFVLTILLSILTYNVIEKPFMGLRRKY